MDKATLEKYANLLVKTGVNLQKGQQLLIGANVDAAYFARMVCDAAYDAGAANVTMQWNDEHTTRARFLRADDGIFDTLPPWQPVFHSYYDSLNACTIYIDSDDPDLLANASPERVKRQQVARNKTLARHRKMQMENHVRWCIAAIPSPAWAAKVFPGMPEEAAVSLLWEKIAQAARLDCDDPVAAWSAHVERLKSRIEFLHAHNFKSLRYKNSLGTDATVELPKNHIWFGGAETCKNGLLFSANIPSEEVYTAPKNTGVNGRIVSSMPLIYNGVEIDGFEFEFVDGKAVRFKADKNEQTLRNILDMDDGAKMLGEVALVPHDSPISNMGILFYNTLFDENASCHFALGRAYPCVRGYESMSKEELSATGLNDSLTHVDFMVGTSDLSIVGTTQDGKEITVFRDGNFAF